MAWLLVFAKGKQHTVKEVPRNICLSAVVPIDKLSLVVSIVFSYIVFKEKLSVKSSIGLVMIIAGTLVKLL